MSEERTLEQRVEDLERQVRGLALALAKVALDSAESSEVAPSLEDQHHAFAARLRGRGL